jgi:hypothetical protein
MTMNKILALALFLFVADSLVAQSGGRRTGPPPVIRQDPAPLGGQTKLPNGSLPTSLQGLPDPAQNLLDPSQPRPTDSRPAPFRTNRPLLKVDGFPIMSSELNSLVRYYRSFRDGSTDILLRDAVQALVPRAVMQAHFGTSLPEMEKEIQTALGKVAGLENWTQVVAEFSDDKEDDSPKDGAYVFGREIAVQPFDRFSHTLSTGQVSAPFLTVYGYHFIEVTAYEQKPEPKDDLTHVRHILVMFPELMEMEKEGKDIRKEIKRLVSECKIELLEDGLQNILPPKLRSNLVER